MRTTKTVTLTLDIESYNRALADKINISKFLSEALKARIPDTPKIKESEFKTYLDENGNTLPIAQQFIEFIKEKGAVPYKDVEKFDTFHNIDRELSHAIWKEVHAEKRLIWKGNTDIYNPNTLHFWYKDFDYKAAGLTPRNDGQWE